MHRRNFLKTLTTLVVTAVIPVPKPVPTPNFLNYHPLTPKECDITKLWMQRGKHTTPLLSMIEAMNPAQIRFNQTQGDLWTWTAPYTENS